MAMTRGMAVVMNLHDTVMGPRDRAMAVPWVFIAVPCRGVVPWRVVPWQCHGTAMKVHDSVIV